MLTPKTSVAQKTNRGFVTVDLEQGTKEWLDWRKSKITASEIASIVGQGFNTPEEVWQKKKGLLSENVDNRAMKRGRDNEPHVRRYAESVFGRRIEPLCIENAFEPWIASSLDGLDMEEQTMIHEIKVPGKATHLIAANGNVPPKYYLQIQWQILSAANSVTAMYWSAAGLPFRENPLTYHEFLQYAQVIHVPVARDKECQDKLYEAGKSFLESLNEKKLPVDWLADISRKFNEPDKYDLKKLSDDYWKAHDDKVAAEERQEEVKKKILLYAKNMGKTVVEFGDTKVQQETKNSFDQKKLKAAGIDPKQFMTSSKIWKIVRRERFLDTSGRD